MSRHRNVRKLDYAEECDFDDVYGRSAEEDFCISPTTAAEYLYDRGAKSHDISSFFDEKSDIPEETAESEEYMLIQDFHLNEENQARLNSCLDYLHDIVGQDFDVQILTNAVVKNDFNAEAALKSILDGQDAKDAPKPQRPQRRDRRNIADDFLNYDEGTSGSDSGVKLDNGDTVDTNLLAKLLDADLKMKNENRSRCGRNFGSKRGGTRDTLRPSDGSGCDSGRPTRNVTTENVPVYGILEKSEVLLSADSKSEPITNDASRENGGCPQDVKGGKLATTAFNFNLKPFFNGSKRNGSKNDVQPSSGATSTHDAKSKREVVSNCVGSCSGLKKYLAARSETPNTTVADQTNSSRFSVNNLPKAKPTSSGHTDLFGSQECANLSDKSCKNDDSRKTPSAPDKKSNHSKGGALAKLAKIHLSSVEKSSAESDSSRTKCASADAVKGEESSPEVKHAKKEMTVASKPTTGSTHPQNDAAVTFKKTVNASSVPGCNRTSSLARLAKAHLNSVAATKSQSTELVVAPCDVRETASSVSEISERKTLPSDSVDKTRNSPELSARSLPEDSETFSELNDYDSLGRKNLICVQRSKPSMFASILCLTMKAFDEKDEGVSLPSIPYAFVNGCGNLTPFDFQASSPDDMIKNKRINCS